MNILCVRCEKRRPCSREDAVLCQPCYDEAENISKDVIAETHATVAYLNAEEGSSARDRTAAFMAIFYPKMPAAKVRSILSGIPE